MSAGLYDTTLIYRRTFWMEVLHGFMIEVNHTPDVLVLNTGSWYVPNVVGRVERRYGAIKGWQEKCREQGRDCHVVWRTTAPGHPRCAEYNQPSTSVEEMEDLVANLTLYPLKDGTPDFHWWEFKQQNVLMLESLNKSGLGFDVIPAYDVHLLRPDSHQKWTPNGERDCLHHCLLYGPVEVVNEFLLQLLRIRQREGNRDRAR